MQKDLIFKIDTLIEMSKSTSNIDTLKAELEEINEEIELKKRELEEQKKSMQDEKYVKASDRIIDENIKVSLELKIRKLESSQKELESALKSSLKEEDETHKKLNDLQDKIAKLNRLIETLKEKLASIKNDSESSEYYKNLISEQEKKKNKTEVEEKMVAEEYRKAVENLSNLTTKVEDGKQKIDSEKAKLKDTEANLASNISYIDTNLKKEDEKHLEELENKLEALEQRKEEIQIDAVMIGSEAKELLIEDDRMGCFLKIKELVNLLKKNPYMDIASSQELARVLQEEEERAIRERDIFAADLENKRYDGNDTPVILEREKYLEQQKIELEKELIECQNKIRKIDMEKVRILNSLLSSANQISENLRKELAENKQVMEANMENATPRKKAILIAAYNKKEEELSVVQKIIESYETEMQDLMKQSQMIEENEIQAIQTKMTKIAEDLKDIHKKTMISSKTKDVLAVENDKTRLKELTDRVKEINTIKKFSQTPSEIYDEVEMILGSFITNQEIDEEPKPVIEEPENTLMNNFRIATEPENDKDTYNRSEKNKDVLIEESQEESKENDNSINWFETPVEENVAITPIDMNIESINTPVEETPNIGPTLNVETPLDFQESAPTDFVMDSFNTPLNDVSSTKENTILEPNITLEPTKEIEPINMDEIIPLGTIDNTPLKERWKVIHVEPLESTTTTPKEPTVSSEDVMISDFKDEDYVDFNTLLDGGNV
ncbi:MAG: hypothetical protein HFI08_06620 [Bacilli bacterium]|nr:hypothetical protein [Bacilli bacterium]